jgi:hypothetical protein
VAKKIVAWSELGLKLSAKVLIAQSLNLRIAGVNLNPGTSSQSKY